MKGIRRNGMTMLQRLRGGAAPYLFITPFLVSFGVFFLFPAAYSLVLSFFRYRGYGKAIFLGLHNYIALVEYPEFWTAVYNTFFYLVLHIVPVMIISFLLAVAMTSPLVKWGRAYKPILFLPQVMAIVSASLIWRIILSYRYGVINTVLGTHIDFLDTQPLDKVSVVMLVTWRAIGWFMVIYLAGLTSIDPDINDAAVIDGASAWRRILHITIPLMKPIFLFTFVIDAINSLKIYIEPTLLFATVPPAPVPVRPMLTLLITNISSGDFGLASAVGWFLFILILLVTLIQFRLFRTGDQR
jgi:ABC-type sugar transport system permease subunit